MTKRATKNYYQRATTSPAICNQAVNGSSHEIPRRPRRSGRKLLTALGLTAGILLCTPACSYLKIDSINDIVSGSVTNPAPQSEGAQPSESPVPAVSQGDALSEASANAAPWRENYSSLLNAFSLRLNDENAPEPSYDSLPGHEPVSFIATGTGEYFLYDIDHNGTPELLLKLGDCEAAYRLYIFTCNVPKTLYLGMLPSGHTSFGALSEPGMLVYRYHMGYETISISTLENGQMSSQTIQSKEPTQGSACNNFKSLDSFALDDSTGLDWSSEQFNENAKTNQQIVNTIINNKVQ